MKKLFVCLCILVTLVGCARRNSAADFTLKEQKKSEARAKAKTKKAGSTTSAVSAGAAAPATYEWEE